jgi:iron complex transport system ATP-binding protein
MIEVCNLNITLSGKDILSNLNLTFEQGKFYCIAGPNGSGKTTLLRSLTRILPVNRNVVFIQGDDVTEISQKRLSQTVGLVPQSSPLDYDFSVFDIVMMGRSPYQQPLQSNSRQDIRLVKEAMEYTNTWQLRDMPVRVLSGGEKQRVIIARTLAQQTDILLLDEPVSSLDIYHQIEILQLISRLNREKNITVIAVLHDLNHILAYAHEMFLLHHGKLVAYGNPSDVLTCENIRKVFSVEACFIDNPLNGSKIMIAAEVIN